MHTRVNGRLWSYSDQNVLHTYMKLSKKKKCGKVNPKLFIASFLFTMFI